ncbi:MAG TPA: NAD-dependent epimerase/dehydratase family protein [Candidatus Cybelea sp.]|nr:NAD-dependent epimerase/dehydratase family protein [Candidatus Cybelea sp.]
MASGERVFLTGATGFVGSHVLRELLDSGYAVRALVRGGKRVDERAEPVDGDLRDAGTFASALRGCRYLVHCAALYTFSPRATEEIAAVNVEGTASLLLAAHLGGVERAVLTSSSATLGHADGRYHRSKLDQERAAFAARIPTIALLPTAPVGPGDAKPTPTGKLVRDFARGKILAKAPGSGGMNLVAVEDVARAHVAALQHGRAGARYPIGGENLSMDEIWTMLAEITGKPMPAWRAPYALAYVAGCVDELRCRISGAEPDVPLEGVRMSRERVYADSSSAQRGLDYRPTPVRDALARAVTWFRENGYVPQ